MSVKKVVKVMNFHSLLRVNGARRKVEQAHRYEKELKSVMGQKPAINFGLSVSRLGGAVQKDSIKMIGSTVRRELLSYLETADVYQLVNEESMSPELRAKLQEGKKIMEALKQPKFSPFSENELINKFKFVIHMPNQDSNKEEVDSDGDII